MWKVNDFPTSHHHHRRHRRSFHDDQGKKKEKKYEEVYLTPYMTKRNKCVQKNESITCLKRINNSFKDERE